jgi:hypothetical protein
MKSYLLLILFIVFHFLSSFKTETFKKQNLNSVKGYQFSSDSASKNPKILIQKQDLSFRILSDSTIKDQIRNQKQIEKYANFGAVMGGITIFLLLLTLISVALGSSSGGIAVIGLIFTIPLSLISGLLTINNTKSIGRSTFAILSSLLGYTAFMISLIIALRSCGE